MHNYAVGTSTILHWRPSTVVHTALRREPPNFLYDVYVRVLFLGPAPEKTEFPRLNAAQVIPEDFPEWPQVMDNWGGMWFLPF